MAEPHDSGTDRVFRAAMAVRPIPSSGASSIADVWSPGRASLEWAVLLAAGSILAPVLGVGSVLLSVRARRRGSGRWLAALVASVWCIALGSAFRAAVGVSLVP